MPVFRCLKKSQLFLQTLFANSAERENNENRFRKRDANKGIREQRPFYLPAVLSEMQESRNHASVHKDKQL